MRCSKCGAENPDRAKFCGECASPFTRRCPHCNTDNSLTAKFCVECAKPLEAETTPTGPSVAARKERDGERRHIAVLFCDLVNSTEIASHLDPEEWRNIAADYQRTAAEAVKRLGGHVAKYLGDGVLAFFGWPQAHEDDGERAVRAGLAIVENVATLNQNCATKMSVRVGIHAGPVVIGTGGGTEADVFGDTPNVASRVQTLAEPDSVFITASLHQLISGLFVVEDRGAQRLKGIDQPIQLYKVIQPSAVRRRTHGTTARAATSFVGRDDEMRLLLGRWARAREGEGQVAIVVGEPGIGKSRLLEEFRTQIKDEPHLWIESAGEQFFASTPFHALTRILDQGLGWRGDESKEERASQLERSLDLAGLKLTEAMPLIAEMLSLPIPQGYSPLMFAPDQKRKRLMANLAGWMFNAARTQPVVVAMEDLQWIDPSTLELIHTLVEQSATAPLMLLFTARPEFRAPWPMRSHHAQISLTRLDSHHTREMVLNIAARESLAKEVIDAVVRRTDGVPLFAEELTRLMLEGDGRTVLSEIPATLQNSLMARLDRLGVVKEVAQLAAVLGREFSYELLEAVSPLQGAELQGALGRLTDAELIYPRGTPPDATYQFKHALIHDAAYEALLKSTRRELHRRVAEALCERFATLAETRPEILARHWTEAGESSAAVAAWKKAGERADARRAFKEAEESYRRALNVLLETPSSAARDNQELELTNGLSKVLMMTKGYSAPEPASLAAHARELAERNGSLAQLVFQGYVAWGAALVAGDHTGATAIAETILSLAQRDRTDASLAFAHAARLLSCFFRGDLVGCEDHLRSWNAYCAAPQFRQFPGAFLHVMGQSAINAWTMGHADVARERIARDLAFAGESNSPFDLAWAHQQESWLYWCLRENERFISAAKRSLAISEEHGFPWIAATDRAALGANRAQFDGEREGIDQLKNALTDTVGTGGRLGLTLLITDLAQAQARHRQTGEALATIDNALEVNPEERYARPESLRVRGEVRLSLGDRESAEADFREAIALAQQMSAKAWELRAVTSLARLLRDTNRRDEARAMLAEIYNWFTEGFDTADLKDAKALLDELSGSH